MMNQENLISLKDRTQEQRRFIASLGGKVSALKRNEKKLITLQWELTQNALDRVKRPYRKNYIEVINEAVQHTEAMRKEYDEYIELSLNNNIKNVIVSEEYKPHTIKQLDDLIIILKEYTKEHKDNKRAKELLNDLKDFNKNYLKAFNKHRGVKS